MTISPLLSEVLVHTPAHNSNRSPDSTSTLFTTKTASASTSVLQGYDVEQLVKGMPSGLLRPEE